MLTSLGLGDEKLKLCLGKALVLLRECCKLTADLKNAVGSSSFYCCGGLDVTYRGGKII